MVHHNSQILVMFEAQKVSYALLSFVKLMRIKIH